MTSTVDNVFRKQYQSEWVMDFQRMQTLLKQTVNTTAVVRAQDATFPVVDPNQALTQKGRNGKIPSSDLGLSTVTATLINEHIKYPIDDFDAFRTQADYRSGATKSSIGAVNRGIDARIISALDAGTLEFNAAAATAATLNNAIDWVTSFFANDVPSDGRCWGIVSPKWWGQMMKNKEFSSADWVTDMPYQNGIRIKDWMGIKWIMHTGVTGRGTASVKCTIYHESAIGYCMAADPKNVIFVNDEDAYSGVRSEVTHASALLLNRGVYRFLHNDTTAI